MTNPIQTQHDTALSLAEEYRRDGYKVVVEPGPLDLPFDLGGYRPDLLALKGDSGLIVEVKARADRLSIDTLRSVAEEVRHHPGWRFVLVTAQDIPSVGLPGQEEDPISWDEIKERIEHALSLKAMGERETAYLALWIAFERLLRLQARRVAIPVDRLAPSIVIRQLYSQGELTMEQFDAALACQDIRDRVVHGILSPDLAKTTDQLTILLRELLEAWSEPSNETSYQPAGIKHPLMETHRG